MRLPSKRCWAIKIIPFYDNSSLHTFGSTFFLVPTTLNNTWQNQNQNQNQNHHRITPGGNVTKDNCVLIKLKSYYLSNSCKMFTCPCVQSLLSPKHRRQELSPNASSIGYSEAPHLKQRPTASPIGPPELSPPPLELCLQLAPQNIKRGVIAPKIAHSHDSDTASPLY